MDDHRFFDLSVLQKECVQRSIGGVIREPAHEQLRECGIFLQEYGHSFDGHCCKKICVLKVLIKIECKASYLYTGKIIYAAVLIGVVSGWVPSYFAHAHISDDSACNLASFRASGSYQIIDNSRGKIR